MNITSLIFRRQRHIEPTRLQSRGAVAAGFLLLVVVCGYCWLPMLSLFRTQFYTGYGLSLGIISLAALNVRKKFPGLPFGKISSWLRIHLWLGFITIGIFALHVGRDLPRNTLEFSLYGLFLLVASSGVYGLFLTRVLPPQLRALREEVVYEKIPVLRAELAREARKIVLHTADTSVTLAELYRERLLNFMEQSRGLFYYLYPTKLRCHGLIAEINAAKRYLSSDHQRVADNLSQLLSRKDELDLHAAWQGRLKFWVFAHIGFTYALILLGFVHGWLVHGYSGGAL
jgi:hypothetical protein